MWFFEDPHTHTHPCNEMAYRFIHSSIHLWFRFYGWMESCTHNEYICWYPLGMNGILYTIYLRVLWLWYRLIQTPCNYFSKWWWKLFALHLKLLLSRFKIKWLMWVCSILIKINHQKIKNCKSIINMVKFRRICNIRNVSHWSVS